MPRISPSLPAATTSPGRLVELLDGAGRLVVGVAAKAVFALQLQQGADLGQNGGNLFLVHGAIPMVRRGWQETTLLLL